MRISRPRAARNRARRSWLHFLLEVTCFKASLYRRSHCSLAPPESRRAACTVGPQALRSFRRSGRLRIVCNPQLRAARFSTAAVFSDRRSLEAKRHHMQLGHLLWPLFCAPLILSLHSERRVVRDDSLQRPHSLLAPQEGNQRRSAKRCRHFCRYIGVPYRLNALTNNDYFVRCGWWRPSQPVPSL
jgi:hypothetical protein